MIKHVSTIIWSPTDLTSAASCEYGFLTALDRKLGRAESVVSEPDALMDQIAKLGNQHEATVLSAFIDELGHARPGAGVHVIERAASSTAEALSATATLTRDSFATSPDMVVQACFFDGEFHGYADFIRRTPSGWVVADTKIARSAKTSALLQIAAYADQLETWGLPLATHAELILGTGEVQAFPLVDIIPVFRERRARLRALIAEHLATDHPAAWDQPGVFACGSCSDCQAAALQHDDLLLVAGMRMSQRRKLKTAAVPIHTIAGLAAATEAPDGFSSRTFAKLQAQATLQQAQMLSELEGTPVVYYEVFDPKPLRALPAPSVGDLFFDFEGDPMFSAGDDGRWGLEYLWGVLRARQADGALGDFWPLWADDREQERAQLVTFLDEVGAVRTAHPDMHIYHYAPYEITALKRLVAEHKTHEAQLDDLLRHGVFVDLYAVVRASVRISQPSYSIKKLEPLYMTHGREGDVTKGDDSIAQYHLYRDLLADPGDHAQAAAKLKASLLEYNHYDCESTLELRDWLLKHLDNDALADSTGTEDPEELQEQTPKVEDPDLVRLRASLLARSGPSARALRSADEQTWAMLEGALGYYQREDRPYWWAHFDRLLTPADEWADTKDVIQFTTVSVEEPWSEKVGNKLPRRTLTMRGRLGPGSTLRAPAKVGLLYDLPVPDGVTVPVRGLRGERSGAELTALEMLADGTVVATVVEVLKKSQEPFAFLPMAAVPTGPPGATSIVAAIRTLAEACAATGELAPGPALDILARRAPRLGSLSDLPNSGPETRQDDLVNALLDLDHSYLAVQGPPGTGKTYLGSRVIRDLVEKHGWKVGVVGPSHAAVENMLCAIVKAGLPPDLVGKRDKRADGPHSEWTGLKQNASLTRFCHERPGGYVIGGTAWTFTGSGVEAGSLDLLVIDEAGQFALATTVGTAIASERLLLLGDPQQLPQVSQGCHGEPVDQSALSWVIGDAATMPTSLGYFLETSYRMHPAVCSAVSRLSYDGALRSALAPSKRSLEGIAPGVEVVRLAHYDNSVSSPEEADEVVKQVRRLIGTPWTDPDGSASSRPLEPSDFLVVAPYNAQRQLIGDRLSQAGLGGVRVGTVDKFQGQEAPVVIVSMSASSADEVPRGMEFLLNRNRVNVAVSRAQWLAVLIRSNGLTGHMPTTPQRLLELGGFIGLCAGGTAGAQQTAT